MNKVAKSRFKTLFTDNAKPALQRFFGVSVIVSIGTMATNEFTARWEERQFESTSNGFEAIAGFTYRQYLLPVASVVIDGEETRPDSGWLIHEGDEVWEVIAARDGGHAAELVHASNDWRVNTKQRRSDA